MIVTCPNCSVRYSASEAAIGLEGRKVRCASCGYNWQVDASGKQINTENLVAATSADFNAPSEPQQEPEPERQRDPKVAMALRARREAERKKQQRIRAAGTWAAIVVSLLVALISTWVFRESVVRIWPNTASAFAAIGVETNIYGLEIQQLSAVRKMHGGASILQITGDVKNVSKRPQSAGFLSLQLFDKQGQPVFSWKVQLTPAEIGPGITLPFSTEVRDPPPGSLRVDVSFADDESPINQNNSVEPDS